MIEIGEGTNIGRRCTISAANRITLGKNVLVGPNVLISDHNHEYRYTGIPIAHQGISTHDARIAIGDDTWIGTNAVIVGNVAIGRHCVIGGNTVVNRDIPDYCVAVGNPCRIVKVFDPDEGRWVSAADGTAAERILDGRETSLLPYITPFSSLTSLQVEVSSSCNLRCPQCFQFGGDHVKAFFPPDLWETRIQPLLRQLDDIHLVGIGEPLLCKDLFRYIHDAVRHKVRVHTTSNLQLLDDESARKLVSSGLHELSFSCDGVSRETYDAIRVNGSIEKLRSSLQMINRCKRKLQSAFPKLILNFGAMKSNIRELPQVVTFAKEHHVDGIIAYHNVMYVPGLKEESLYHAQDLSDQMFLEAKQHADKLGVSLFFPGLFSKPIHADPGGLYCDYPFHHLYIYSDGRVGPCCMDFPDRFILGNLHAAPLEEIWNSGPILRLRKQLAMAPTDTCRYCVRHGKMDISDPKYLFRFKGNREYLAGLPGPSTDAEKPCRVGALS
jgi:radical SAM protein with 4Fe4S-binding SPASM domain